MFDNKTLKAQSARETLFPRLKCVCVCANYTELRAHRNDQIHTKYVKMASVERIHLNTVYVLSGLERLGENPMCFNILS